MAEAVIGVTRGLLRAAIRGASQFAAHFHVRHHGGHAEGVVSAQPIGGQEATLRRHFETMEGTHIHLIIWDGGC
jgi:hypothetical protein